MHPKAKPVVLVTAVGAPPGLNALRALKESNRYRLIAADADVRSPALYHFQTNHVVLPKASNKDAYLENLFTLIAKERISVILPCIEEEILLLSEYRDELEAHRVKALLPESSLIKKATDKGISTFIALQNHIDCPRSILVRARTGIESIATSVDQFLCECTFPWIIKPTMGHGMRGFLKISSIEEAIRILSHAREDLIIQEFIPGSVGSMHLVGLLYDENNRVVRRFSSRSIRTLFPGGGPATAGISIQNENLIEETERMMRLIGHWRGPVNVEWMLDPRDNRMKFIEINPRLWGYGYLAVRAGSNFPVDTVDLSLGRNVGPDPGYRLGVTMLRITEDIIFEKCPFPIEQELG